MLFIPATGSTIQFRHQRWLLLLEEGAQRFGEERMVAIPGVGVIECTDKEICLEQACQLQLSIRLFGHALAERPGEPIQHACLEQKALHLRGLLEQDFFTHIIQEKARGHTRRPEHFCRIVVPAQGQRQ